MEWLQSLRAIAAIFVLLFHAKDAFISHPIILKIFSQGFWGVDLFFCLSGYIMCHSCINKDQNINNGLKFGIQRVTRIFSGYWPALLLTVLFSYIGIRQISNLEINLISSIFLTSTKLEHNYLETAWTLVYELRFYVAITLFYFIFKIKFSFKTISIISIIIIIYNLVFYAFKFNIVMGGDWPLRTSINGLYLEFIFGIYIYLLNRNRKFSIENTCFLIPVALLLLAAGSFDIFFANYEMLRAATYGIAAACVLSFFVALQNEKENSAPKLLSSIGDASYSLYLIHPILLSLLFSIIHRTTGETHLALFTLAGLITIIFASIIWYRIIESPLHNFTKKITSRLFSV